MSAKFCHESVTQQLAYGVDFKGLMSERIIFKTLDAR
jgi:hypothetical protein